MINEVSRAKNVSVRKSCGVLGFRRQTYYRRKQGHRPEEADRAIEVRKYQPSVTQSLSRTRRVGMILVKILCPVAVIGANNTVEREGGNWTTEGRIPTGGEP